MSDAGEHPEIAAQLHAVEKGVQRPQAVLQRKAGNEPEVIVPRLGNLR